MRSLIKSYPGMPDRSVTVILRIYLTDPPGKDPIENIYKVEDMFRGTCHIQEDQSDSLLLKASCWCEVQN